MQSVIELEQQWYAVQVYSPSTRKWVPITRERAPSPSVAEGSVRLRGLVPRGVPLWVVPIKPPSPGLGPHRQPK